MDDAAVGSLENSFNFRGQAAQLFKFFGSQCTFCDREDGGLFICLFVHSHYYFYLEEDL